MRRTKVEGPEPGGADAANLPKVKVKRKKEKGAEPGSAGSHRSPGDGGRVTFDVPEEFRIATEHRRLEVDGYPARSAEGEGGIPVAALPPGLGTAPATTEVCPGDGEEGDRVALAPRPKGTSAATTEVCRAGETPEERKKRRAREISAKYRAELKAELAAHPKPRRNPLLDLPEDQTEKLFAWLRECPYHDAVKQMLAEQGIERVTDKELDQFFELEASSHWQRRLQRAATEANALVTYIEEHPVKFSAGILAALGQEAFRQIASGNVAPEAMTRMTNLFLKARADERSDQLLDLRREDLQRKWRAQADAALEAFAVEIEKHPAARDAFEALRAELPGKEEE